MSIATVSRVINNGPGVGADTAVRVREAIKELGYVPNRTAKALVSGRSHILGIIVSDITNPFFPEMIKGFEEIAIQHGYEIITASSNYDSHRMEQCVLRLIQRSVDGVAIMTSEFDPAIIGQLTLLHVPTVFLDVGIVSRWVSNVRVDYERGICEAVAHLVGLGHRKIAFISGPRTLKSAQIRKEAFLRSLREAGIQGDHQLVVEGNHGIEGGLAAMQPIMHQHYTAVLASNDLTAIGALRAIRHSGLSVPRDISVVGFDDIQLSQYTDPPLTTVRLARADVAAAAFEALLRATRSANGDGGIEMQITTTLVVRESTGPVTL